jgi:acetyl-CoA carboxylase beta subunit
MSRWDAESDLDYWDEVEGHHDPYDVSVSCIKCQQMFYVRADERGPYWCEACQHNAQVKLEQRQQKAS